MKIQFRFLMGCLMLPVIFSCETLDLDLQESPNSLTVDAADPDLILNSIQLSFVELWNDFNDIDLMLVRMENMRNTYASNVDDTSIAAVFPTSGAWAISHSLYNDVEALIEIAGEDGLPFHKGMAQFFKAYTMITMVDHLGEVVFSQANNPEEFPLPRVDPGEEVYAEAFDLLDEAAAFFAVQTVNTPNDLFYNGNASKWIKAVNSLKLKMFITTRRVNPAESTAGINAIIASGNYIQTVADDFTFRYSSSSSPVESRHPLYRENYGASFPAVYMSNDLLHLLKDEKFNVDPRLTYYIYRQTWMAPSGSNLPCAINNPAAFNYCYVGNLYWGRDHKDAEGIPNDAAFRSTFGIYPAGGAFDPGPPTQAQGASRNVVNNSGLNGAGILPFWLSSFSSFTMAEAAFVLGTTGDPEVLLEEGIRKSFQKVESFSGIPMSQANKDAYVNEVLTNYRGASQQGKLEVIMTEFYIALFGNGVEAYNTYRRTGYPNFPPGVVLPNEAFPRSYLYPSNEINNNPNIEQRNRTDKVFWDTLPDSEIN